MKYLFALLIFLFTSICQAGSWDYDGSWKTVRNIRLSGPMKCTVTSKAKEQWQGRFTGVWQGQPFSYTVDFVGPTDKLQGKADVDGGNYNWTGKFDENGRFIGTFTGDRYTGSFDLVPVPK